MSPWPSKPLFWLLATLGLALWLAGLRPQGPDLEVRVRGLHKEIELEIGGQSRLRIPRPSPSPVHFSLRLYESTTAARPSGQSARGFPGDGSALDQDFVFSGRLRHAWDANLVFTDASGREGAGFVIRPAFNDLGWAEIRSGRFQWLQGVQPLETLRWPRQALRALVEAASAMGAAAVLGLAAACLAWLLARLRRGRPELPFPAWLGAAWLPALCGLALAAWAADFGFERLPHVSDEISATFQARLFAEGRAAAPLPPDPAAFKMEHVLMDGRGWRSKYAPLWPWVLSLGERLGAAWLVMPLAFGAAILAFALWLRRADPEAAGPAAWLLALSPFALVMSGSRFNHTLALLAALALFWGVWRLARDPAGGWGRALLGAAALGALRPFTAACLLLGCGAWLGLRPGLAPARRWGAPLLLALAAAAALMASNAWVTGHPLLSPYLLYDPADRPGFGAGLGSLWTWGSPGHDAAKAWMNTRGYLADLHTRLFGWPGKLCLGLVALNFALRRGVTALEGLLLCGAGALAAGHFFYWCLHFTTLGAFYWFQALPALVYLSARGLAALQEALAARFGPAGRSAPIALALTLAAWGLLHFLPVQAWGLRNFGQVNGRLARLIRPLNAAPALVLIRMENDLSYNPAFALQDPRGGWPLAWARSRGPEVDRALAASMAPRRALYHDGDQLTPLALRSGPSLKGVRP